MGILIAIEGVDASGKQTQTELLKNKLESKYKIRLLSFPMYDNPSSTGVKMYLNGNMGKKPEDVNAYAASMLFASDRYITYKTDWHTSYENGEIIIADRYVSSNMIHQAGKIDNVQKKNEFLDWAEDFEYNKLGLPRPNVNIFLDMPPEYGRLLMQSRENKIDGSNTKDIHENNFAYLKKSYDNAIYVAERYNWKRIKCVDKNGIRTIEDINNEIFKTVSQYINTI